MKRLAIIGAGSFQNPLILKAKSMGFETHVFAWQEGAIGERTADYFYPISITEKDAILDKCRLIQPEGIVSIASDLAVVTVNYVAGALGLPANPLGNTLACTNKYAMREALASAGIPVPRFMKVNKETDLSQADSFSYPIVVKPTDRSGSRGVTKLSDARGLKAAVSIAIQQSFEKCAIVEEFIEGDEYSCECISHKGEHHFLALTKKYTTGAPHFIETGHLQPSGLDAGTQERVIQLVFRALDALGIENGASHTEFRVSDSGQIGIIEIGARMGGDCIGSDLVQISTGYDFLRMTIDVACGKAPDFTSRTEPRIAMIRFIFSNEDIEQLKRIQREAPQALHYVSDISAADHEIVDSSTRLGYYILSCKDESELESILRI